MESFDPPPSYYDPPDCPYEINDERMPVRGAVCERCKESAVRSVEMRDMRVRYGCGGTWHDLCEDHHATALEDYVKDLNSKGE